jgi:threonine synthase
MTWTGELACARCGNQQPETEAFSGCARCVADGIPMNVFPTYDLGGEVGEDESAPGLFRHRRLLPLRDHDEPVSLGEGDTPLLPLERIGADLGLERFLIKDETRGPTWSYKDRLAAVAVTRALASGADTVVVGTTGNHGAASAAYAAAAGIRCVAITLVSVPQTMKVLMQVLGADVAAVHGAAERWALMRAAVAERGWVPLSGLLDPPVGSNPFGIDGYKTIAYEMVEDLGAAPDAVLVPIAYGDGLVGIHRGFRDLHRLGRIDRLPRMVAVEPLGPYTASLAAGGEVPVRVEGRPSVSFSIAGTVATRQGLDAMRESGGRPVIVGDDAETLRAQYRLASEEGLYLEASAAVVVPAVERLLADGDIAPDETIVAIGTSSGLKDVGATAGSLPYVPVIGADLAELDRVLG